jgi:hypothetical protein
LGRFLDAACNFWLIFSENDKKDGIGSGLMVLFIFGLFPSGVGYYFLFRQNKHLKEQKDTTLR